LSAVVVFVAAMYVPYAPANIFNVSVEISDVRTESNRMYCILTSLTESTRIKSARILSRLFILSLNTGCRYFNKQMLASIRLAVYNFIGNVFVNEWRTELWITSLRQKPRKNKEGELKNEAHIDN